MGLAQKRIVAEYQNTAYGKWKEEFDKVVGFSVPMDVKWETMQSEDYQGRDEYFTWYNAVYFEPLMRVFKNICKDQLGKDAVKSAVKKIVIDGSEGYRPFHSTYEDGVFTLRHQFHTNIPQLEERVETWTKLIESKL